MAEFPHSSPDALQRDVSGGAPSGTQYGKEEVAYRPAGSSNTRCERCSHFSYGSERGVGSCDLVAGRIEANAVCDLFERGGSTLVDLITGEETR